jgi:hypothetical protein
MNALNGRVALITGSSRGIGAAIAAAFARRCAAARKWYDRRSPGAARVVRCWPEQAGAGNWSRGGWRQPGRRLWPSAAARQRGRPPGGSDAPGAAARRRQP